MKKACETSDNLSVADNSIALGQRRNLEIPVSASFSGDPVSIPLHVWRADKPGPVVFITAAVHGDEINGTGIIREMILRCPFELQRGTLLLVPVVNVFGFNRHMRYLPDRRDLNRSFPGSPEGSQASRIANVVFREIVARADFGIDLHTGAVRRTNYPNVRGDLNDAGVARIASAFGCELILNSTGPIGSLRRSACEAGCPTICVEAGEVSKFERFVLEVGLRGITNILRSLGMVEGNVIRPAFEARVNKTKWLRADTAGIMEFHVAPGDVVEKDQPIATIANMLGDRSSTMVAPMDAVILGMTTVPTVSPGDPVCHLAIPARGVKFIRRIVNKLSDESPRERIRDDLATNIAVQETEWENENV